MVNLNDLLQSVLNAEASLKVAEADVAEALERKAMAADALRREQGAFDKAVADARALVRPSPTACVDASAQLIQSVFAAAQAASGSPEVPHGPSPEECQLCGEAVPAGAPHTCRRMEGAPGPLPSTSPLLKGPPPAPGMSWAAGAMPAPGYAPEAADDREENTGVD